MHTRAEGSAPLQHTSRQSHRGAPVGRIAKPPNRRGLLERCEHSCVHNNMEVDLALVDVYAPLLAALARSSAKTAQDYAPVSLALWRTVPGIGNILAMVLRYEIEAIARFPRVPACVSSGRLIKRAKESHGTRHGTSGQKSGYAHLTWAFSAAVGLVRKTNEPAKQDLATLATRHGTCQARSSLAYTRGRAVSCRLTHPVACNQAKFLAA